jgi:hypothetical protein
MSDNNKDFIAISIRASSVSYPPKNSKLFCNLCSRNLTILDPQKEEWYCTWCNVSYFPKKGVERQLLKTMESRELD